MSSGATRARANPRKSRGFRDSGGFSTEARVSSTGDPLSSTGWPRRLWTQRTATASLTATDPGPTTSAYMATHSSRFPPSAFSHGVVVATPSWARSMVRQRSTRSTTESRTPPISSSRPDPGLLLERLGRLQDQVGAQPAPVGVDPELARAPLEGGGADERDRAGVEVRRAVLEEHLDAVAESLGELRVEGRVAGRPRVVAAADPDGAVVRRRRGVPEDLVAAAEPAGVLAGREPAVAVDHGVGPVADQAAVVDVDAAEGFAAHRLHGVAADLEDGGGHGSRLRAMSPEIGEGPRQYESKGPSVTAVVTQRSPHSRSGPGPDVTLGPRQASPPCGPSPS